MSLIELSERPYNAETPMAALLEEQTPRDLVYVRNHFDVPRGDADAWSLTVDGTVESPTQLSYSQLRDLPSKTIQVVLECAGNGRKLMAPEPPGVPWGYGAVSVVTFTGTQLSNLLQLANPQEGSVEAVFIGADRGEVEPGRVENFTRSLPLEVALDPDTIVAWSMNGQPLSPAHGFPLRLVVPGWYGMASVKWLTAVTLRAEPYNGFFQTERYVYLEEEGTRSGHPVDRIRVRSLILSPSQDAVLPRGEPATVAGIAWSGSGEITQVELSADGGAQWFSVELEASDSPGGIQRWRYSWTPDEPGSCTFVARATDSAGNSQPAGQRWNRLGYGNNGPHRRAIVVR